MTRNLEHLKHCISFKKKRKTRGIYYNESELLQYSQIYLIRFSQCGHLIFAVCKLYKANISGRNHSAELLAVQAQAPEQLVSAVEQASVVSDQNSARHPAEASVHQEAAAIEAVEVAGRH